MRDRRIVLGDVERNVTADCGDRLEAMQESHWCFSLLHQLSIIEFENRT